MGESQNRRPDPGFGSFFAGELLTHVVACVTLRRGSATGAGEEFLTERQFEDAVTPHLTRPRELIWFSKNTPPSHPAA